MINTDDLFEKKVVLHVRENEFVVRNKTKNKIFVVDKVSMKTEPLKTLASSSQELVIENHGLLGVIEAKRVSYLVIVTSAKFIGCILKSEIFKVEGIRVYPFYSKVSDAVFEEDELYISMFKAFLNKNSLYFSDTYDLTNSIRGFYSTISNVNTFSFQEVIDVNFCWNYSLMKLLDLPRDTLIPTICGCVNIIVSREYFKDFTYALISRRETRRAGVRYHRRGIAQSGAVDNFYETELI